MYAQSTRPYHHRNGSPWQEVKLVTRRVSPTASHPTGASFQSAKMARIVQWRESILGHGRRRHNPRINGRLIPTAPFARRMWQRRTVAAATAIYGKCCHIWGFGPSEWQPGWHTHNPGRGIEGAFYSQGFRGIPVEIVLCCFPARMQTAEDSRYKLTFPGNAKIPRSKEHGLNVGGGRTEHQRISEIASLSTHQ